jgi:hypothetical protein
MERFASKNDVDIESMLADKDSVKILREYCAEKELPTEFYKLKYKQSRT